MTSVMTLASDAGQRDRHHGHVPRLSYRNPLPQVDVLPPKDLSIDTISVTRPTRPGLSIREIREALPQSPVGGNLSPISPATAPPQKTKKSFLGGLFAKEPSMAALDQVTQQMIAQHGSVSPTSIPHVSSQKMPDHVPKVNSKWDGVPEYIKMREKMEKERARYSTYEMLRPVNSRSRSSETQEDQSFIRRRNSNAASTADTWDSRSTGSRPVFQDDVYTRPESICSTSSSDSTPPVQRLGPNVSSTHGDSYAPASPDTSIFPIEEMPIPPRDPKKHCGSHKSSTKSSTFGEQTRHDTSHKATEALVDVVPEYTSSSTSSPLERSPKTPTPFSEDDHSLDSLLREDMVRSVSVTKENIVKRPTNSRTNDDGKTSATKTAPRAGLGLRTNSVVAPWETQLYPTEVLPMSATESPIKSRGKGRFFSKDKK